jgi:hypothetical protein
MPARLLRVHAVRKLVCACAIPSLAFAQAGNTQLTDRERMLLDRIEKLEQRISTLEAELKPPAPAQAAPQPAPPKDQVSPTGDKVPLPGFAGGTTVNFLIDGYYLYNFNNPVGGVNLLLPYTPSSNSFTVNQALVSVERAVDPDAGRLFGLRLDLMFGQATEALSGNPANEPRTPPYRNIYQAYGTFLAPLGKGLNIDFGRIASPLGFEGTITKDQINYTRSFIFTALPFYHLGFRSAYKFSDSAALSWLLVNGANQSEDFNGFKSNGFLLGFSPHKKVAWNSAYYFGNENRQWAIQPPTNEPPGIPAPPGVSVEPIEPRPNGLTHIADTYLLWNALPKLVAVGEGAYIVSRTFSNSQPVHMAGGAGYLRYQFLPQFSLAARYEYVSDRGYLSGISQALKEGTLTATYEPVAGFQLRGEYRHDYSNQPFFLSSTVGVREKRRNSALFGLSWWFGGRTGPW